MAQFRAGGLTRGLQIPPRPARQQTGPDLPTSGQEPFDEVVDPPFLDLALRLDERARSETATEPEPEFDPTPSPFFPLERPPTRRRLTNSPWRGVCEVPDREIDPSRGA